MNSRAWAKKGNLGQKERVIEGMEEVGKEKPRRSEGGGV